MSLNWDVSKIASHPTVTTWCKKHDGTWGKITCDGCTSETGPFTPDSDQWKQHAIWHPLTEALVWHCLGVGIGTITDDNAVEFTTRVRINERLFGASLRLEGEPHFITLEDVRSHVGLSTNVYPKETRTTFMKKTENIIERELIREEERREQDVSAEAQG